MSFGSGNRINKSITCKQIIDKFNYINIKKSCSFKDTTKRNKKQTKILTEKFIGYRVYKAVSKSRRKKKGQTTH